MSLVDKLIENKIINKEKASALKKEIAEKGKREEEVILENKIVVEDVLFNLKSQELKIPIKRVVATEVPLEVLNSIPEETAKHYQMIPIAKKDNNVLGVGMVYPEDLKAQEALKFLGRQEKFTYEVFLITLTDFENLLKQYKNLKREVGKALEELEDELIQGKGKSSKEKRDEIENVSEEAPITKIVAVILRHAVEGQASDVHIEPTREDKFRVRFRLIGLLHPSIFLPMAIHPAVVARIKIVANLKIDEKRIPQDGRFSTKIDNKVIDFRVSTFPTTTGEKVVIRVLDSSTGLKEFEDLGLRGENLRIVKETAEKPYGMILSTGPTGSGKSTTLYSVLRLLNKVESNIITLEDPVEYFIEGINQSQVRPEIGYTFANGLRSILRQDPDIIMVGEIRDEETANLAIHASLTGHLVLSTLHTNNAVGVIPRFIDMGIKPYLISPTVSCIIAQRLVRKLCDHCKEEVEASEEMKDLIMDELRDITPKAREHINIPESLKLWHAKGCKYCGDRGYSGRIAIMEVLEITDSLAEIILQEPTAEKLNAQAKQQGMISLKQDGILKALEGETTLEEILRVAEEK